VVGDQTLGDRLGVVIGPAGRLPALEEAAGEFDIGNIEEEDGFRR
jgi:hypothetical protein